MHVRGGTQAEALAALPAGMDADVVRVAGEVSDAVAAGRTPAEGVRAGIVALLDALARNPECVWWWVAIWPASPRDGFEQLRPDVEEALLRAFTPAGVPADIAVGVLRDGWALVHEHLWRESEPDLASLVDPLMALLALRVGGLSGLSGALTSP